MSGTTSGAFKQLEVSWPRRAEADANGVTSPEELLAASHASCYAMAFSAGLTRAGSAPQSLEVSATVTFDKVGDGFKVVSSALEVLGRVPNMDEATFVKAAEAAKDGCPISQALKGNVNLSVKATLQK
jgi:osmotically inducible protein OsmC